MAMPSNSPSTLNGFLSSAGMGGMDFGGSFRNNDGKIVEKEINATYIFHLNVIDEQLMQFSVAVFPSLQQAHDTINTAHVTGPLSRLLDLTREREKQSIEQSDISYR